MLLFLKPILVIFPILALFLSPINASRPFPSTNELDSVDSISSMQFLEAPDYQNGPKCPDIVASNSFCNPSLVHIAMTLDPEYLRGTIAAVHSVIKHTSCPESIFFHFIASDNSRFGMMSSPKTLTRIVESAFPALRFKVYLFKEEMVKSLISSSIREALDNPLNYARSYLADILETCVDRVVYLDSDVIVVDDIVKLWKVSLTGSRVIGAPEYCHTNFSRYFSNEFWIDPELSKNFEGKKACYFNTGVMVMDLKKWRDGEYTMQIEKWMRIQKGERRIYELGSLPPFLLVFAGEVEAIEHRWNQHGLGGDNRVGNCRSLHPGPVSLLHWSGKGKPWRRLDEQKPCPVDALWEPYDLYKRPDHLQQ